MKDWRRSPEPPGMMGLKDASYQVQGNWGQPEELADFDPASPLPHTTPAIFGTKTRHRHPHTQPPAHQTAPLSLYSMCLRVVLRNLSSVQDLGVLPYRHAKPILEECRIEQLIQLEEASPHLLEHTEEIWKRNCLRDFIDLRRKYAVPDPPRDPKSWRKLYFRTQGEIEQAKTDAARRIKDKYEQFRAEKEAKKLVVRDRPILAKVARAGGRKFGGGVGGVSKGQSLLNKARSGSAAQAKLTAPRNGIGFKTQGRSKAVGVEIAPEAAGVRQMARPMVAPKKVLGVASEGLAKMREFSRVAGAEAADRGASGSRRVGSGTQRSDGDAAAPARRSTDTTAESSSLACFKPHEVAAAPPLTSSSSRIMDRPKTSQPADTSRRPTPSSPPPDMARTERRKIDFFGGSKSSPSSSSAALTSTSARGPSPLSPGVDVRAMKRTHSSAAAPYRPGSSSTQSTTSPPASSSSPFFSSRVAANSGSVRVVQAKRARTQDRAEADSPGSPPTAAVETASSFGCRPAPVRQHSSRNAISRSPVKDPKLARASPAALSSIFMPSSSSPPSAKRNGAGGARNGFGR